ncbi:hypothetical protein ACWD0J_32850 [Streptomyces sp. NPDC003011]
MARPDDVKVRGDGVRGDEGMDLGVLLTELPLVLLAGAVLPVLLHALLVRLLGGPGDASDRHG